MAIGYVDVLDEPSACIFWVEVVKMSREQKWLICEDPQVEKKKLVPG